MKLTQLEHAELVHLNERWVLGRATKAQMLRANDLFRKMNDDAQTEREALDSAIAELSGE